MNEHSDLPAEPKADIGELVQAICNKCGIADKSVVAQITIDPMFVTILYYPLKDGKKYLDEAGELARKWLRVQVTT